MVGTVPAYLGQFLRSGGTHYEHQPLAGVSEFGIHVSDGITYHALIQRHSVGQGQGLELLGRLVGGHGEDYAPASGMLEEGPDGVASHIGGQSHCVKVHGLEKSPGIAVGGVADVSALGVGDDQDVGMLRPDVADGLSKLLPAGDTLGLVKGDVGLVGDCVLSSGVDNCFVESQYGSVSVTLPDAGRNLLRVGVKTHAEERALAPDIVVKFSVIHLGIA